MSAFDYNDFDMIIEDNRLKTFKSWPFRENCACIPEKMAETGFYCCGSEQEPDLVRCFMCFKELDGWEPEDNPVEEHKRHSKECAFVNLGKKHSECSMKEIYTLEMQRNCNLLRKLAEKKLEEFKKQAEKTRVEMEKLREKKKKKKKK